MSDDPWKRQEGGDHYKSLAIQPSEYIVKNHLGWFEGNAIKYLTRHAAKGGAADLRKAIHYAELALAHNYTEEDESIPLDEPEEQRSFNFDDASDELQQRLSEFERDQREFACPACDTVSYCARQNTCHKELMRRVDQLEAEEEEAASAASERAGRVAGTREAQLSSDGSLDEYAWPFTTCRRCSSRKFCRSFMECLLSPAEREGAYDL